MPRLIYDKEAIIADWKTGKYTERALAGKHKVSSGTIHNIVKGIEKTIGVLISKQVEINQELANLNEHEISRFKQEVDTRTKQVQFFQGGNLLIASTALRKVKADGEAASYQDLNAAANTLTKAQENVLGKQPDTAIQINNHSDTQQAIAAANITLDAFRQEARRLQDAF